jgi:hypothetical protein
LQKNIHIFVMGLTPASPRLYASLMGRAPEGRAA